MHQFVFDLKLAAEISIMDDDLKLAETRLAGIIEDINRIVDAELANPIGPLVSADVYIDDVSGPLLVSVDGVDVEDLESDSED